MPTLWVTDGGGELLPLESAGYASEAAFQALLAERPEVLASAIDSHVTQARWLLVDRELDIRAQDEGDTVTWRLDHLFLTPDGMPVLVEVKRSSDARARREVVAQMLDYAASFAIDWNAARLRDRLVRRLARGQLDREAEMSTFLDGSPFEDEDQFWTEVHTKISAGRIRLLFVADRLSGPLIRIIEYLSAQLRTAEIMGVEVVRHASAEAAVVAYQPAVRGRPTTTSASGGTRRSRSEFDAALEVSQGAGVHAAVNELITRAVELGAFVSIGSTEKSPRLFLNFTSTSGRDYWPIAINPGPGKLVLFFRFLKSHPAFADESVRAEIVRLMEAVGQKVRGDNLGGFPFVPVSVLTKPGAVDGVVDVLRWIVARADASSGGQSSDADG